MGFKHFCWYVCIRDAINQEGFTADCLYLYHYHGMSKRCNITPVSRQLKIIESWSHFSLHLQELWHLPVQEGQSDSQAIWYSHDACYMDIQDTSLPPSRSAFKQWRFHMGTRPHDCWPECYGRYGRSCPWWFRILDCLRLIPDWFCHTIPRHCIGYRRS